jgi:hypothetical protein
LTDQGMRESHAGAKGASVRHAARKRVIYGAELI